MKIAVGIATAGRPEMLHATIGHIARQTRQPDMVVICPAAPGDVDPAGYDDGGCRPEIIHGPRGLTHQRNTIIEACRAADMLIFFDDDFLAADDFIAQALRIFEAAPEIAMATGDVLADGIAGPGISVQEAADILASAAPVAEHSMARVFNAYGCNMVLRMAPVIAYHVRFDENLPLYGWQEDVDFSRQMAAFGKIVKSNLLRGVHLGVKSGRYSGLRFGYSQIANPLYMLRKKSLRVRQTFWHVFWQIFCNVSKNVIRAPAPEPWIDRVGRLRGNALAFVDMLRGRLDPGRILDMN
jgi:GT2 family glycosyltransferase